MTDRDRSSTRNVGPVSAAIERWLLLDRGWQAVFLGVAVLLACDVFV